MRKGYYQFLNVLLIILIPLTLLVSIVAPFLLIGVVAEIIFVIKISKKIKQIKVEEIMQMEKENTMLKQGYRKIYNNMFIDETNKKINILGQDYGFTQIIDYELVSDETSMSFSTGNTKIKNIKKAKTTTITTQNDICKELYINIVTDDFQHPKIKFNLFTGYSIYKNSKQYKKIIEDAYNIEAILKLIISKNNEKYVENGSITKIEHRYVNEADIIDKVEKLAQLHKEGILTDYEFSTKKMELLEKLKK